MRIEPVNNWVVGRALRVKREGVITTPNENKEITRVYRIESVSSGAEAAGYHVGDFVIARAVYDMILLPKVIAVPHVTFLWTEAVSFVRDATDDDFVCIHGRPLEPLKFVQPKEEAAA